jgi:lipoate synthase
MPSTCRHLLRMRTYVGHATMRACMFVGVQHSRQPRVAQHMKEQVAEAVQDNLSWHQCISSAILMYVDHVVSRRCLLVAGGSDQ